jgi:hypothetical protein
VEVRIFSVAFRESGIANLASWWNGRHTWLRTTFPLGVRVQVSPTLFVRMAEPGPGRRPQPVVRRFKSGCALLETWQSQVYLQLDESSRSPARLCCCHSYSLSPARTRPKNRGSFTWTSTPEGHTPASSSPQIYKKPRTGSGLLAVLRRSQQRSL